MTTHRDAEVRSASDTVVLLPAALSIIAGVTDVTSWLLLGGFFSAHVTGNLVVVVADILTGTAPDIAAMIAIPLFVITIAGAAILARRVGRSVASRSTVRIPTISAKRSVTLYLLGAQAVLLTSAAILSFTTRASEDPGRPIVVVIGLLAVAAMAAQNAYLHIVPIKAASTAVMTGNLVTATVAAIELIGGGPDRASARARWSESWPLLVGFVSGCLIGAAGVRLLSDHAAVIPAALAVLLVAVVRMHPPVPASRRIGSTRTEGSHDD